MNGMSTSGDTAAFSRRNQASSENSDDDVNVESSSRRTKFGALQQKIPSSAKS
jgi:hypothetical protein